MEDYTGIRVYDREEPIKHRKKRVGDMSRFTPKPMGKKWGLQYYFNIKNCINSNLKTYRYSYYQGGILHILYEFNEIKPKEFLTKKEIIYNLSNCFLRLRKPRNIKEKSVDSAISALGDNYKIFATFVGYKTMKGPKVVLGYHISPVTEEMANQIEIFRIFINWNKEKIALTYDH